MSNRLIIVPSLAARDLPTGYPQRAQSEGACLIRKESRREVILEQALASLDGGAGPADAELVQDFLALGYCYLQVQLLTRQMRYASNLDEAHFRQVVVSAANAAMEGQAEVARDRLAACFHLLAEERDHYYSVDVYLLDLTLVASTTIGASLRHELLSGVPTGVLLTGDVLERMTVDEPETLNRLRNELEAKQVTLVGGDWSEARLPLLSSESVLRSLERGGATFERYLGKRPEIYGRRRFGLSPALPAILRNLGYRGAMHFTLDDGRCPLGAQSKTRWEGADGAAVDAAGKPPLDASKPETFLGLATKLGGTMDSDHVATLMFAHWPSQTSRWFDDLKRACRYCSALGKFVTLEQYFRDTIVPSHQDRFTADQYQSPYLKQSVIRNEVDPISRWVNYWWQTMEFECRQSLEMMSAAVRGVPTDAPELGDAIDFAPEATESLKGPASVEKTNEVLAAFTSKLPRRSGTTENGCLVVNPLSFTRRIAVRTDQLKPLTNAERPVLVADHIQGEQHAVVEVPPFGFAWVAPSSAPARPTKKAIPPLAEDGILRNEYFEAVINSTSGSLQSIHIYNARGNRLSQQLAVRLPDSSERRPGDTWRDPDDGANYSVMAADSVRVTLASKVLGEITTRGRLLSKRGDVLAKFQQRYQLSRGSRILRLEVELEPTSELLADPWNSYIACRFAWPDEAASLWRAVNEVRQPAENKRFESPLYVELNGADERTTILTGGIPYHRRTGPRMLDSLLIVRGETQRRFRLGFSIDSQYPLQEAYDFMTPSQWVTETAAPPSPANTGWLFHLDAKNVLVTHAEPLIDAGKTGGVLLRIRETAGRAVTAKLSSYRNFISARQVDHRGQTTSDCAVEAGVARVDVAPNEWLQLEARWS